MLKRRRRDLKGRSAPMHKTGKAKNSPTTRKERKEKRSDAEVRRNKKRPGACEEGRSAKRLRAYDKAKGRHAGGTEPGGVTGATTTRRGVEDVFSVAGFGSQEGGKENIRLTHDRRFAMTKEGGESRLIFRNKNRKKMDTQGITHIRASPRERNEIEKEPALKERRLSSRLEEGAGSVCSGGKQQNVKFTL